MNRWCCGAALDECAAVHVVEELLQLHSVVTVASTVAVTGPSSAAMRSRGVTVEAAEDDDAGEVGLVAVVEDEVVAGGVVAEVADVGVRALGLALQGQRRRERAGLLDPAVVDHVDGHGQLGDQVAGGGAVGEGGGEALLADRDLDLHRVLLSGLRWRRALVAAVAATGGSRVGLGALVGLDEV